VGGKRGQFWGEKNNPLRGRGRRTGGDVSITALTGKGNLGSPVDGRRKGQQGCTVASGEEKGGSFSILRCDPRFLWGGERKGTTGVEERLRNTRGGGKNSFSLGGGGFLSEKPGVGQGERGGNSGAWEKKKKEDS